MDLQAVYLRIDKFSWEFTMGETQETQEDVGWQLPLWHRFRRDCGAEEARIRVDRESSATVRTTQLLLEHSP